MSENKSVEVNKDVLEKFFSLADLPLPDDIDSEKFEEGVNKIEQKLVTAASMLTGGAGGGQTSISSDVVNSIPTLSGGKSVLVVDDLGIVTIQLESLFKKLDFDVTVSKELFDAIEKYKTQDFNFAVVDLFIPTEREGFILIEEIKKLSLLCQLDTKIIVMSASSKTEHHQKSIHKGANIFIEKTMGWQDKIVDYCLKN